MTNIYEDLRSKVIKLYNCKGSPGDLKRLSEIYRAIEAADIAHYFVSVDLKAALQKNEELKRQIEVLKQEKKTEKEEPVHKAAENTCDEFVKEVDEFVNSLLSIFGSPSGSEKK